MTSWISRRSSQKGFGFAEVVLDLQFFFFFDSRISLEASYTKCCEQRQGIRLLGKHLVVLIYLYLMFFLYEILDTTDGCMFVSYAGECQSCPEDERLPND